MAYVPVLSNVNYEDTRRVSKSPCCKILRYQSVTILQRYEYRTRTFRVQVLCCLLCLSCSCSVNASVSAAPSLVCPCSIVKTALRLLALSPTAPSSRVLRGTGTPPEVKKFSISVAQVEHQGPGNGRRDKCLSEPRKNLRCHELPRATVPSSRHTRELPRSPPQPRMVRSTPPHPRATVSVCTYISEPQRVHNQQRAPASSHSSAPSKNT